MSTRRLAAILAADVVGFSAMMERDEEGTAERIRALRLEVIEPALVRHNGRLVKTTGDGFLAEFASPVEAVRSALTIQDQLAAAKETESPMRLRVGINLGDIIIEPDGDIFGDGVNVAARLEQMADAGGVCISASIHDQVAGKIDRLFEDRGDQQVKNIGRSVRVYALVGTDCARSTAKTHPLPNKPSIAVLPFHNLSGDAEQEYFADGMVEDIITALSRIRWLFVIARNSSFIFKGNAATVTEIGTQLGVRYALQGSVRKGSNRVRITGQLIEAATGAHIWAERYDRDLTDIFDVQDEITESVVGAIEPSLRKAEIDRAKRKRPDDLDAYDLYLRALSHMYEVKPEARAAALAFVDRALTLNPAYVEAHGVAAWCYFARSLWEGSLPEPHKEAMIRHGRAVQELQTDDASTLAHAAIALALATGDYEAGLEMIDRAIALNPSSAHAHGHGSVINTWAGNYDKSIALSSEALRLSPFDPLSVMPLAGQAGAWMMKGEYATAVAYARRGLQVYPTHTPSFLIKIASLMRLGRKDEAEVTARQFMAESPNYRIIPRAPVLAGFVAELRGAGLPG